MYRDIKDLVDKAKYYLKTNRKGQLPELLYNKVQEKFDYAFLYKNLLQS